MTSVLVTGRLQSSGLPYGSGYTHGFTLLALLCLAAALAALRRRSQCAGRLSASAGADAHSARTEPEAAVAPARGADLVDVGVTHAGATASMREIDG